MRLAALPKSGDSTCPSPSEMLLLHRTKETEALGLRISAFVPSQPSNSGGTQPSFPLHPSYLNPMLTLSLAPRTLFPNCHNR